MQQPTFPLEIFNSQIAHWKAHANSTKTLDPELYNFKVFIFGNTIKVHFYVFNTFECKNNKMPDIWAHAW